ncbi:MAG: phospho-N-acetylmuramoyl-pentapeptide-transferase [Parcubacteria group bacterium]|nr:phospho-N-acetylmuramoyl-pentapeptide-transferase [Parcubacteria group bacterium]
MIVTQAIRFLSLGTLSFLIAMLLSAPLLYLLKKYQLGKQIRSEKDTPVFAGLHKKKEGTPTMGGIIIWFTIVSIAGVIYLGDVLFGGVFARLNFINRAETYLPLAALCIAALIGLVDDVMGVLRFGPKGGGLSMKGKLLLYILVATIGALWFYFRLDWNVIHVPLWKDISIGIWYIPLFIFILTATAFSTNETDGLDGLAAGVLVFPFVALGVVAFLNHKYDLAMFIATLLGALVAFLWNNVYPAKFFMGDTGAMSLGIVLGVIAMLTNTALLLPFFASILMLESLSVIVQMSSKKIRGKKIFLSTPIHHHFEALGLPETNVTMKFWIVSGITTSLGLIIFFLDKYK